MSDRREEIQEKIREAEREAAGEGITPCAYAERKVDYYKRWARRANITKAEKEVYRRLYIVWSAVVDCFARLK